MNLMIVLGILFFTALLFVFVNGFHDGCNVIATIICSRSLSPKKALLVACLSEFAGAMLFGTAVAATIGKGIIKFHYVYQGASPLMLLLVLITGLWGGIAWNIITWKIGFPSSSSHALIGGLVGSSLFAFGIKSITWNLFFWKVIFVLFTSPFIGMFFGYIIMNIFKLIFGRMKPSINNSIKKMQIISMAFLAASHGANDSQKSMGIMTLGILFYYSRDINNFHVPLWVQVSCALAIAIGLSTGGWSIVKTVGMGIFRIRPVHSLASQTAAALVIGGAGLIGGPVSSTQIVGSSIAGVGASNRVSSVRWGVVKNIFIAWITTIPAAGFFAAVFLFFIRIIIRI